MRPNLPDAADSRKPGEGLGCQTAAPQFAAVMCLGSGSDRPLAVTEINNTRIIRGLQTE